MFKKYTILTLPGKNSSTIQVFNVIQKDILRWISIVLLVIIPYATYAFVLSLAFTSTPTKEAFMQGVIILSQPLVFIGVVVAAVLIARQSIFDTWTWVLCAILVIFYALPRSMSFAMLLLLNSPLPALVAMVGILAIYRIVEYFYAKRIIKLESIEMTKGAIASYISIALLCFMTTSPVVFEVVYPVLIAG